MSTILIVANQTLPSAALAAEVARRIAAGATVFHVVVPATPPPGGSGFTWDEDAARAEAETRLTAFLERLRGQGPPPRARSAIATLSRPSATRSAAARSAT
jgi:hypothetical protein